MKQITWPWFLPVLIFLALASTAYAQGGFVLSRSTVDNGGGTLNSGGFTLTGAIGQPDASVPRSSGGFSLTGGIFAGVAAITSQPLNLYLPLIFKLQPTLLATLNNAAIPIRPVTAPGEVFYTATFQVPVPLLPGGKFYLSASPNPNQPTPASVDDKLTLLLNGQPVFSYQYGSSQGVASVLVEVPRSAMEQIAGQTTTVQFSDVLGVGVQATPVYLIWVP